VIQLNGFERVRIFTDGEDVPRATEGLFPAGFIEQRQAKLDGMVVAYGPEVTLGQVDRRIERYRQLCESKGIKGRRFQRRLFARAGWWAFQPKWTQGREQRRANWLVLRWYYGLDRRDAYALVRLQAQCTHAKMEAQRIGRSTERMGRNRRLESQ
jgi:hypothetical protein